MMLNEQEKNIERYLNNEMDDSERRAFESAMAKNAELADQVTLQKDLIQFFKERNPALEDTLSKLNDEFFKEQNEPPATNTKNSSRTFLMFLLISLFSVTAIVGGYFYFNNDNNQSQHDEIYNSPIDAEEAINKGMLYEGGQEVNTVKEEVIEEAPKDSTNTKDAPVKIEDDEEADEKADKTEKAPPPMASVDMEKFKVNPLLENIILEDVRSNTADFKINTPKSSATFYAKNNIVNFKLKGESSVYKNIEIILYDNQKSSFSNNQYILSTTKNLKDDNFSVSVNIELEKGLYYYVIQEKQTGTFLYTSKFYVK